MPITVHLKAPEQVDMASSGPTSTVPNPLDARVDVTFKNDSAETVSFPGMAIVGRLTRTYKNPRTSHEQVFRRGQPPFDQAEFLTLAPGESWRYGVGFELPDQVLTPSADETLVDLCIGWDKAALDPQVYAPGDYWAESFEVCQSIKIRHPH